MFPKILRFSLLRFSKLEQCHYGQIFFEKHCPLQRQPLSCLAETSYSLCIGNSLGFSGSCLERQLCAEIFLIVTVCPVNFCYAERHIYPFSNDSATRTNCSITPDDCGTQKLWYVLYSHTYISCILKYLHHNQSIG